MEVTWQRYAATLLAAQSPVSSLTLTRRSDSTRYQTHSEVGLGIVGIVVL